jgi:hypothetical protein
MCLDNSQSDEIHPVEKLDIDEMLLQDKVLLTLS